MSDGQAAALLAALRKALGPQWEFNLDRELLEVRHRDAGTPFRPPRHTPDWAQLLTRIDEAFARQGVPRAHPLPLRWGRETDFTISAVQALDPYLKHNRPMTYRHGYLPQPVIRFTGKRHTDGRLRDGFLTAFVNVSRVQPIASIHQHAAILDGWVGVLSQLGLHARHLRIRGHLAVWTRSNVQGVSLHFVHRQHGIGDIVLLWNRDNLSHLATDLGSGLERLRWAISGQAWHQTVFGPTASSHDPATLDVLRTATLAVGSGIQPAHRGPGSAIRRLLGTLPAGSVGLGTGTAVRAYHRYWSLTTDLQLGWADIARCLEDEVFGHG
jgi:hypothetical protein